MQFLRRSRKKQELGDIFVFQIPNKQFVFGRVIRTDVNFGTRVPPSKQPLKMLLVYIYNAFSGNKDKIPDLNKNNLLIPPEVINRLGWTRGYFETIEHRPLKENDILSQHCFMSSWNEKMYYFDEYGNQLPERVEPCGVRGIGNYRIIDDLVSDALDIPRAP